MTIVELFLIIAMTGSLTMLGVAVGGFIQFRYSSREYDKFEEHVSYLYNRVKELEKTTRSLESDIQDINESMTEMSQEEFDPNATAELPAYKPDDQW